MNFFDKNKIQKIFQVKITDSQDMHELINLWQAIYQGTPWWVGSSKNQVEASLNIASTIVNDLATKCVSEIAIQDTNDEILKSFWNNEVLFELRQQVEYALASGAVVIRPYFNESLKKVCLSWYTADRFIPVSWDGKKCMSGIFIDQDCIKDNDRLMYYTKLECHKWEYSHSQNNNVRGRAIITVKAFVSESSADLAKEIPLTSVDKWASIPKETVIENLTEPLFVYCSTPFANNKAFNSKAGVSLYKDGIKILEEIDRTYDTLCWEIQSTQHKVFVDSTMIEVQRKGDGDIVPRLDDKEKRLYKVMDANGAVNKYMDEYSPVIRQADITATLKTHLSLLCSNIHLDSGAYIYDEQAHAVTAREITSKQQKTYQTICDIQKWCLTPALKTLFNCVKQWQMLYDISVFKDDELMVSYGDSILTDEETIKETAQRETSLGLRSKKSYLMEYRGLSEEEAEIEIERINSEKPQTIDFFGNGNA